MWGGEERTDKRPMLKGSIIWHASTTRIKYFEEKGYPESTCFATADQTPYFEIYKNEGKFLYKIETGFDRKVSYFGEDEVRFDLRKEDLIIEIGTGRVVAVCD